MRRSVVEITISLAVLVTLWLFTGSCRKAPGFSHGESSPGMRIGSLHPWVLS